VAVAVQLLLCQVVGQFLTGQRDFQSWIPPYVVRDIMHENFKVSSRDPVASTAGIMTQSVKGTGC